MRISLLAKFYLYVFIMFGSGIMWVTFDSYLSFPFLLTLPFLLICFFFAYLGFNLKCPKCKKRLGVSKYGLSTFPSRHCDNCNHDLMKEY